MRRFSGSLLVLFLACAIGGIVAASETTPLPPRESAVVQFPKVVKLMGVLLKGEYLIIHDEEKMARGEACTYVYRGRKENADKLVVSFHCVHIDRAPSEKTKISYANYLTPNEIPEVKEIQFAGSSDGHRVP